MRGKVERQTDLPEYMGITPAYAGKSGDHLTGICRDGDHPRVCGEKKSTRAAMLTGLGSPPRMRGKD